ncbi:DMT family transporter [Halocalculus aciditolerans]|uniref:EamA family transporter n=1 Tax=Halocalculus aciditolerans TaxID=1383812 RepID=A0A830F3K9_9EURY|nr:EamA family transporter [Halocalculus aciditolerans]GGL59174.1 EamA family transporter [Halocalculus aciditolerans]
MSRSRYLAAALFAYVSLAWGGSFVAIKAGLDALPPLLFAAFRFDVGAAILLGIAFARTERGAFLPRTRGDVVDLLVSGGLIVAVNNGLLFVAQQHLTSGTAAIVYSLNPILSIGVASLLLPSDSLDAVEALGVLCGLVGVVIVANPEPNALLGADTLALGLVFVAAAAIALGSVVSRRVQPSIETAPGTAWAMVVGAVGLHAWAAASGETLADATMTPTVAGILLYLGLFATAFAYLAYFTLIRTAGPVRANLVSYTVPLVATVAGAALLGEPVTAATLLGFSVIVAGFVLLNRRQVVDALP